MFTNLPPVHNVTSLCTGDSGIGGRAHTPRSMTQVASSLVLSIINLLKDPCKIHLQGKYSRFTLIFERLFQATAVKVLSLCILEKDHVVLVKCSKLMAEQERMADI